MDSNPKRNPEQGKQDSKEDSASVQPTPNDRPGETRLEDENEDILPELSNGSPFIGQRILQDTRSNPPQSPSSQSATLTPSKRRSSFNGNDNSKDGLNIILARLATTKASGLASKLKKQNSDPDTQIVSIDSSDSFSVQKASLKKSGLLTSSSLKEFGPLKPSLKTNEAKSSGLKVSHSTGSMIQTMRMSDDDEEYAAPVPAVQDQRRSSIRWIPVSEVQLEQSQESFPATNENDVRKQLMTSIKLVKHTSKVSFVEDKEDSNSESESESDDEYVPPPTTFYQARRPSARRGSLLGLEAPSGIQFLANLSAIRGSISTDPPDIRIRLSSTVKSLEEHLDIPNEVEMMKGLPTDSEGPSKRKFVTKQEVNQSAPRVPGENALGSDADMYKDLRYQTGTASSANLFQTWFVQRKNVFLDWYYRHISYKLESFLALLSLSPFVLLIVAVFFVEDIKGLDYTSALLYKLGISVIALLPVAACGVANDRHAVLSCMVKITHNEANVKDIMDTISGKKRNWLLSWAAQLSIHPSPATSYYGEGMAAHLTNSALKIVKEQNSSVVIAGMGGQYSCRDCVGFWSADSFLVPVSSHFSFFPKTKEFEVISTDLQDIFAIQAQCGTLLYPSNTGVIPHKITIRVNNIVKGNHAVSMDFEILDLDLPANLFGRKCCVIILETRGVANVRYSIRNNYTKRKKVEDVKSMTSNCMNFGEHCLGSSKRSNIAYELLKATFSESTITFDHKYASTLQLFPDPSINLADEEFSKTIASFIGSTLLQASTTYIDHYDSIPALTDKVVVKLDINPILKYLSISLSILCILLATILIFVDLVQLDRASDSLLRRLSKSLDPGRENLESIIKMATNYYSGSKVGEDWIYLSVKYGEDRDTMSSGLGILRFGTKKDVSKYRDDRAYY